MSGEAIAGILAGSKVEVCSVDLTAEGGLLLGLITDPPTWVTISDPPDIVAAIDQAWGAGQRIVIPMPPSTSLMYEPTKEDE